MISNMLKLSTPKKQLSIIALIIILVIASLIYWRISARYVSTDDAYLNANVVEIAPRVTGQVQHLYVVNNQLVRQGQVLFDLDPAPFIDAVNVAKAQVAMDEAHLKDVSADAARTTQLVHAKFMSAQAGDDTNAAVASANAKIQLDQAHLDQAQLNLNYTRIIAPVSGWVTNMSLRVGNTVTAYQSLFALVDNSEFWADANFKETQLAHIRQGQKATIKVDMYPDHPFAGVVHSISSGSGTAFSLLPPQNATGNWVKVTQRIPVRVEILNPDAQYPLRIGATAAVTIDTSSGK